MTNFAEALKAHAPALSIRFQDMIRGRFERAVKTYGAGLDGIYNSANANFMRNTLSRVTKRTGSRYSDPVVLVEDKLVAYCDAAAEQTVLAWIGKIEAKLGDLDNVSVARVGADTFTISGERAGRRVVIEQSMIVNVSSKGTLFNQFPARIYVDGKLTAAAAYEKTFA